MEVRLPARDSGPGSTPGATGHADAGRRPSGVTVVDHEMTVRLGTARLRAAPVDLPDVPGSMLLHDPDRRWVYAPDAVQPLDLEMVRLRIAELGWSADTIGTSRAPWPGG